MVRGVKRDATFPIAWGNWRALIERFNLDDELPLWGGVDIGSWNLYQNRLGRAFPPGPC